MEFEKDSKWALVRLFVGAVLLLGYACCALAWIVYSSFVRRDEVALQHDTWTQVPAHVLECRVHKAAARYRNQSTHEWLQVRYSYVVDGVRYVSDEVGAMDHHRIPMFREAEHRAGTGFADPATYLPPDLCCYVNPENPQDVVLFADVDESPWWWRLLLFCVHVFMLVVGVWSIRELSREIVRRVVRFFRR